ncbi:hypothetical protein BDZ89DRAFT_1046650 [Hymenopellis radicata]|nr:hypothetical protein BDZ89DRAFT_1046650 [Hymenopellis radicata]
MSSSNVKSPSTGVSPPSALRPPTDFNTRNRSASLPNHMAAKVALVSRIPKPIREVDDEPRPSRIPKPQSRRPSPIPPPPNAGPAQFPTSVSTSICEQLKHKPRSLVKPDPNILMRHLRKCLGQEFRQVQPFLDLDDLVALHERELMEREERDVFGAPLRQVAVYASTVTILGGLEHELPIVVYSCVEELYRALKAPPSPARSSPTRVASLVQTFDTPPHFGCTTSLFRESESDVFALLSSFLSRLPEPIVYPQGIVAALAHCCSLQNVDAVQRILRLLPSANLSVFVYLLAFLSQVNQTKAGIEADLGDAFGQWLFGLVKGPELMVWFIRNWTGVVRGLFDLDWDEPVGDSVLFTTSPLPVRADSLELPLPSPYDLNHSEIGRQSIGSTRQDTRSEAASIFSVATTAPGDKLLNETLPYSSPADDLPASPPLLRVANPGSRTSTKHFLEMEKKLKISDAVKEVPEVGGPDAESVFSREAVVVLASDGEGCSENCAMRLRVVMLEAYLLDVLRERDEARQVVEEIRALMEGDLETSF